MESLVGLAGPNSSYLDTNAPFSLLQFLNLAFSSKVWATRYAQPLFSSPLPDD